MKKYSVVKDIFITVGILTVSFIICMLFQRLFTSTEHITTLYVFAVFLISILTDGYFFGIFAAFVSVIAVNFAFTYPLFKLDFTDPVNIISATILIVIAILTSTLTTKLKRRESLKYDGEKERMRANLLRAISHDLRTPLTTIYGSAATLLDSKDTLTPEQKQAMLKGIKEESEWLTRMVENLLSITRLDSGKVKILKSPTAIDELIDSVIIKFKKRYPNQKVDIDIPEDILVIPMDALLIEQVINNLLENSVQHATGMTKLILKVYIAYDTVFFEVRDNGCGIDPEKLQTIFNGYYDSIEPSFDSRKKNAGIGLSVCDAIVRAHGGIISAGNLKDGGAIFKFSLALEE